MRIFLDWLYLFNTHMPGRRRVLSEALSDPPARNTGSPLKGGPPARHALWLVNIPDRNISIRCRARRKVRQWTRLPFSSIDLDPFKG